MVREGGQTGIYGQRQRIQPYRGERRSGLRRRTEPAGAGRGRPVPGSARSGVRFRIAARGAGRDLPGILCTGSGQ